MKTIVRECKAEDCQHNSLGKCKFLSIRINKNFECARFKSIYEG